MYYTNEINQPTMSQIIYCHALELYAAVDKALEIKTRLAMKMHFKKKGVVANKEMMKKWYQENAGKIEHKFFNHEVESPAQRIESRFWRARIFAMNYLGEDGWKKTMEIYEKLLDDGASCPDSVHYNALIAAANGGFPVPPDEVLS